MELQNLEMYTLQVKDLNGNETKLVQDTGLNLKCEYPFLQVGQQVREWEMYIVTPFGFV